MTPVNHGANDNNDASREMKVSAAIKEVIVAVQRSLDGKQFFPALILLYCGIDIFASWLRPVANQDTTGEDFKAWVDRYLLSGSSLPVTASDLWSARCGLVHTGTPGSRTSRAGKAKPIQYATCGEEPAMAVTQLLQKAGHQVVVVDVEALFKAFLAGLLKFLQDIMRDKSVRDVVLRHADAIFYHSTFEAPK